MVELYQLCRGGMGEMARLPDAGGVNDQCNWLMEAFGVIAATFHELKGR
nr:hypothetical protein [uncultured Dongia sp.]